MKCKKGERYVRIGFEDNAVSHDFKFFNVNLSRCRHLLINAVLLLSLVLGSAVRIANFPPDRGCSGHSLVCMTMRDKPISNEWKGVYTHIYIYSIYIYTYIGTKVWL